MSGSLGQEHSTGLDTSAVANSNNCGSGGCLSITRRLNEHNINNSSMKSIQLTDPAEVELIR
jgi:hypothetical protein